MALRNHGNHHPKVSIRLLNQDKKNLHEKTIIHPYLLTDNNGDKPFYDASTQIFNNISIIICILSYWQ